MLAASMPESCRGGGVGRRLACFSSRRDRLGTVVQGCKSEAMHKSRRNRSSCPAGSRCAGRRPRACDEACTCRPPDNGPDGVTSPPSAERRASRPRAPHGRSRTCLAERRAWQAACVRGHRLEEGSDETAAVHARYDARGDRRGDARRGARHHLRRPGERRQPVGGRRSRRADTGVAGRRLHTIDTPGSPTSRRLGRSTWPSRGPAGGGRDAPRHRRQPLRPVRVRGARLFVSASGRPPTRPRSPCSGLGSGARTLSAIYDLAAPDSLTSRCRRPGVTSRPWSSPGPRPPGPGPSPWTTWGSAPGRSGRAGARHDRPGADHRPGGRRRPACAPLLAAPSRSPLAAGLPRPAPRSVP